MGDEDGNPSSQDPNVDLPSQAPAFSPRRSPEYERKHRAWCPEIGLVSADDLNPAQSRAESALIEVLSRHQLSDIHRPRYRLAHRRRRGLEDWAWTDWAIPGCTVVAALQYQKTDSRPSPSSSLNAAMDGPANDHPERHLLAPATWALLSCSWKATCLVLAVATVQIKEDLEGFVATFAETLTACNEHCINHCEAGMGKWWHVFSYA